MTDAKAGNLAKAEAIINKPVVVHVAPAPVQAAPVGISYRENWKVDPHIDLSALVAAIVKGTVPVDAVMPNMPFLNQMARAMKGRMEYPGVSVRVEKIVASR